MTPQPSPPTLLSLPPELRNAIFAHTLTAPNHILQYWTSTYPETHSRPRLTLPQSHADFNQLKYTCRQLYFETAGLELKYNTVRFDLPEDDAYDLAHIQECLDDGMDPAHVAAARGPKLRCAATLSRFLWSMVQRRDWLRCVVVRIRRPATRRLGGDVVDGVLLLTRFRDEHPQVDIAYEFLDEVYPYAAPKWQVGVTAFSVAACVAVAMPVGQVGKAVVATGLDWCGESVMVLWGVKYGVLSLAFALCGFFYGVRRLWSGVRDLVRTKR